MAKVYKTVDGVKLERVIATTREAQSGLKRVADRGQGGAAAVLAAHHRTGQSYVAVHHQNVDWFVSLVDPVNGWRGAWGIEFGRKVKGGRSKPVAALRTAFGLKKKRKRG